MKRTPSPTRRKTIAIALTPVVLCLSTPQLASASDSGILSEHGHLYVQTGLYSGCEFHEPADGGPVSVYVFVLRHPGDCTASLTFRVGGGDGFTGTYVGETSEWGYFGNAEVGIWMGFSPGITATGFHLVTVQYMTYGTSSPCSWLRVEPYPSLGAVWIYDCNTEVNYDVTAESAIWRVWFNGVSPYCDTCTPSPVGTEPSTWGRVKALYK
jgi:hypothetical protein